MYSALLQPIQQFLLCATPTPWLEMASKPEQLPVLLIDHCNCELKAAQTAMFLIRKYAVDKESGPALLEWLKPYEDYVYRGGDAAVVKSGHHAISKRLQAKQDCEWGDELINKMVLLIKEELHHFQQVLEIMEERNIPYQNLRAGRYAAGLMKKVRTYEPAALVDKLIIGAYIEARSCERFAALIPFIDDKLGAFYTSLLRSEARHYQDYLTLAQQVAGDESIAERVKLIGEKEAELILSADSDFYFHSGVPVQMCVMAS